MARDGSHGRWRARSVAIIASACLHIVLLVAVASITVFDEAPTRRPERLTDAPATTLTLRDPAADPTPPPQAPPEPAPEPLPSEPAPAEPEPARPEPVRVVTPVITDATVRLPDPAPEPPPVAPARPVVREVAPPPPPPPTEMVASFAGVEGVRAGRIVYVIDASAAMVPTFRFLRAELARSLMRLEPRQSFQIIAYRRPPGGTRDEVLRLDASREFLDASASARDRAGAWLAGIEPSGSSFPLAGLEAALALHPDLVFLLTTSIPRSGNAQWGDGTEATLAALNRLNPVDPRTGQRPTVIKAVQFVADDPTGMLHAIAATHGDGEGSYRVVQVGGVDPAR
jgi:hypothetical protein